MQKTIRPIHILKKSFTILCIFVMLFYFLPLSVFAETLREEIQTNEISKELTEENAIDEETLEEDVEETQRPEQINEAEIQKKQDYKTKKILREETDKRTANEKHYILEDGTKVVTMYPSNVHYKEKGKFVDVDNTLEEKKDTKETLKLTEKQLQLEKQERQILEKQTENAQEKQINTENVVGSTDATDVTDVGTKVINEYEKARTTKVYENKANSYKTKFTNKTKDYYLGSLTSEGHTITWRLKNANSTNVNIKNPKKNKKIEDNITVEDLELNQIASKIEYNNILSDTNINYVLSPEKVKENIILNNEKAINNKLVFEYALDGLEMKLLDNNDIIIYKDNEKNLKFRIQAPFMYDSKLEFTDKIKLDLKKKNGNYELTLTPDKEWLQEEGRQYPVTIDPTVQTASYIENINDVYIYKGDTNNTTRWQAHILRVGNGSGNPFRTIIKFGLPTINSGDQVIAAELSLRNYPNTNEWTPPTEERVVDIHRITSDWESKSANWSNISSKYDSKVIDYVKYKYDTSNTRKDNRFDITTIVKDWYTVGKNYGVMLKEHTEKVTETSSDMYFYASDIDSTYENYRPKVIIAYRNQTGLEDYLSYHTQSAGRAGEVYTNDYNGNLTLIHNDTETPGNRLPVGINHVYNTNEKDVEICYGKGMRLNLSQILVINTINSKQYLRYIDEDGTSHYMTKNATTNLYEDEDGLGLTVKTSSTDAIMTDKAGNKMTFQKYPTGEKWHLKSITDTSGNQCNLTLVANSYNYLITQVEDTAGDKIQLTYSSGRLQKITDVAGRNTTYTYDSSGRLTTITHPDSKKSIYTYGSKNELTKVQNIDGSYLSYSYYPGPVYRVKSISEYGTAGTQGKSLTITYGHNLTNFKDNQGYSNTYAFDNYGHATSVADFGKADQNVNNAYGKAYKYGTSGSTNNKLTLESRLIDVYSITNNLLKNVTFDSGLSNWIKR